MSQMRAVLIKGEKGPVENLYLGTAPKPAPADGQVLVKIKAFGLNRMDIAQREGLYPPPAGSSSILGVEFSGTVAELGPGAAGWQVGDEVLGLAGGGAYAEYIVVQQTHLMKKPSNLSWVEAASIPEAFLTAYQALVLIGDVKKGDDVLIHAGASGVGIAAIQLARQYEAKTVTATASTQEKLDGLLRIPLGATHVVNYKTQDFAEEVKKTTNGKGVDVIIDFVGQSHWKQNIDSLAVDGRMTLLSFLSGPIVPEFNIFPLLFKRLRIQGSALRSRSISYQTDLISRFNSDVLEKISGEQGKGPIRTYIHKVYPWTEIQDAHRCMAANTNSGKLIVEVV
ncbi:hypothetical protein HGRIS_005951 [Hohenbuehelia grisea]|uniref:Enoyl reductase (ER) domain-containing protein n=1 Tax=Hohenbuehelia grisea TaxID=104357 RepID=A0ABR3JZJ3_9AGAR